jgi:hypothetical protein
MREPTSPALKVALAFHQAWSNKDLDLALSYLAEDIVCDAPPGRIEGIAAYREFMAPFVQMLVNSQMIAAFGDQDQAVIVYDTRTALVESAPAAECVTVLNDKITYNRFIFDRAPFDAARRARA